jgi:hypothetical protein
MSIRRGDENLLHVIRDLRRRVDYLESQNERSRRNDLRIGDLLISWDPTLSQMTMRNLRTGGLPVTIHVP